MADVMPDVLTPTTPEQLREAIGWAVGSKTPLEIIGSGSKRAYGHAVQADRILDCSKLSGILFYEPEELVISARAGTPLLEIFDVLKAKKQQFHFEPGNFPALLGDNVPAQAGTIGGLVATNMAGPRRIKVGSVRDHVLGFEAISGRAEDFKSGGRVMKNVTGFDLSKLMSGSFGTLGVMHTVTLKVMPCDERSATVLVVCNDLLKAGQVMAAAMGSENEVSAAAWIASEDTLRLDVPLASEYGSGLVALRVEGPAPSVSWRAEALCKLLGKYGDTHDLPDSYSQRLWKFVADVAPFVGAEGMLWRISVPPASGGAVGTQLIAETGGRIMMDWAGGLIWLHLSGGESHVGPVRAIADRFDGTANLVRAPEAVRQTVPVFHPANPALARINARIKENFDPEGILNPGRLMPSGKSTAKATGGKET